MNAMAENGIDLKTYTAEFDSISLCLSKGLGAPVGSLLFGTKDFIKRARRVRKVFGGGMRQAGIIAAGGLYALKNNVDRTIDDHTNAKALEVTFNQLEWVEEVLEVQTNIVVIILKDAHKRDAIIAKMTELGIRTIAFGPGMIRFVTHLDISKSEIDQTISLVCTLKV